MDLRTLGLYLIGDRDAILRIAASRHAIWVGLLFVLSAGFAREYDGEYLLREPWHLFIPLGASLASSLLLFVISCGPLFLRDDEQLPFLSVYRSFLTLFWMTAPMAWLYAIPYERFLSPGAAVSANLWTLTLVAAWRVLLMIRVVSVITGRNLFASMFLVMAFADAVALAAVFLMPVPVISFMGGVRLTEGENAILGATLTVRILGILSAPVWVVGALIVLAVGKTNWLVPSESSDRGRVRRAVWGVAAASLALWLPILPWTQAEQQFRWKVERGLKSGQFDESLDFMSAHSRFDFPPAWDPPPRVGYRETQPPLLDVLETIVAREVAPWVRALYVEKLHNFIGVNESFYYEPKRGAELARIARILELLPEGPEIAANYRKTIEDVLQSDFGFDAEDRKNLQRILKRSK